MNECDRVVVIVVPVLFQRDQDSGKGSKTIAPSTAGQQCDCSEWTDSIHSVICV